MKTGTEGNPEIKGNPEVLLHSPLRNDNNRGCVIPPATIRAMIVTWRDGKIFLAYGTEFPAILNTQNSRYRTAHTIFSMHCASPHSASVGAFLIQHGQPYYCKGGPMVLLLLF